MNVGVLLCEVIELSRNDKFCVKFLIVINVSDVYVIDIKYYKNCWIKNVLNVFCKFLVLCLLSFVLVGEIVVKIEFLIIMEIMLRNGNVFYMLELDIVFNSIVKENGVVDKMCSCKVMKQLLQDEIFGIEFYKLKRVNELEMVIIKEIRDFVVQFFEEIRDIGDDIKILYDVVLFLRKVINNCRKWMFDGFLESFLKDNFLEELYCFFRWVINGLKIIFSVEEKC